MKTFRTKQVIQFLGNVTQNQIVHWAEKGIVAPSLQDADGHGSYRLYILKDLVKMRLVTRFLDFGMSLRSIRKRLDWLENQPNPDMASDGRGIKGADGKIYGDLWQGLRENRKAFTYYCEAGSDVIRETGFTYSISWRTAQHALFINVLSILETLEEVTGESL